MTHDTKRSFEESRTLATRLSRALTGIERYYGCGYEDRIAGQAAAMERVAATLELIATTPDATLSRKTLAAFDRLIDAAVAGFQGWADDLLDPTCPIADDDIPY